MNRTIEEINKLQLEEQLEEKIIIGVFTTPVVVASLCILLSHYL